MTFFQHCREVINTDIVEVFQIFYVNKRFQSTLNASFDALIPKKKSAMAIKDYRLISLIGGIYKIIAKVLSFCLRKVIGKVITGISVSLCGGASNL